MFLRNTPIDLDRCLALGFWSKVDVRAIDECWPWLQSTASHGYGQTWDGVTVRLAHRVGWALANEQQVPDGMTVDHICHNRTCINPDHLRLLTNVENARDNRAAQRAARQRAARTAA